MDAIALKNTDSGLKEVPLTRHVAHGTLESLSGLQASSEEFWDFVGEGLLIFVHDSDMAGLLDG